MKSTDCSRKKISTVFKNMLFISTVGFTGLAGMSSQSSAAEFIQSPRIGGARVSYCSRINGRGACDNFSAQRAAGAFCWDLGYQRAVGFDLIKSGNSKRRRKNTMLLIGQEIVDGGRSRMRWEFQENKRRWFRHITCE